MVGVVEHVRGVGVDLQHQVVAEPFPHGGDAFDVDAGLDLELDPDVPVVEVAGDLLEQLLGRVEDPDRHARPARARPPCRGAIPNDSPAARSSASRIAISTDALAIGCPSNTDRTCATSSAATSPAANSSGAKKCSIT